MTRFFLITIVLLFLVAPSTYALGVTDFVAVADGANSAVYNPAGLAELEGSTLSIEHRFTGRDIALGWDDIMVYAVSDQMGTGALFINYSQDYLGSTLYKKNQAYGYSYGWQTSEKLAVGLGAKFSNWGNYDNGTGVMIRNYSRSAFLMDFGLMLKPSDNWQIGFAFHNLGRPESAQVINYQSTLGCAYQYDWLVLAGEIYDLMNEGDASLGGSIIRVGARMEFFSKLRVHLVYEESAIDWTFQGKMVGLEYIQDSISTNISWYQVKSEYLDDYTIQVSVGYHF